jgi:CubicO group peptidase (beta-lactamase class C family)
MLNARLAAFLSTMLLVASDRTIAAGQATGDGTARVSAFATALRDRLGLPSLAIAVSVDGGTVASVAIGWADVESRDPATTATRYRIGSISKLLTATTALRLQQAGAFDLDSPIGRYLRGLPADKAPVTSRQLAGHLGGFRHYGADDYVNTTAYTNVADSLPRLLGMPLLGPPGAAYAYSSNGYNVFGAVLQGAAGKEFRQLVTDEVLAPLGMSSTRAEPSAQLQGRARLYSRGAQNAVVPSTTSDITDRWPSGGFISTADDIARFGTGVLRPSFLNAESQARAFQPQQTIDGKPTGVGIGWRIANDSNGRLFVHHGGDAIGGRAFLLVYPGQSLAVALATNIGNAGFNERDALEIAAFFLP